MNDIFDRAVRWATAKAAGDAYYSPNLTKPYAGYSTYQGSIDIVNPDGETYVCASFVWYLLTAGGFDVGPAVAAVGANLNSYLCGQLAQHGWGWYPWTNINAVQRGDVLIRLNNDQQHIVGHTEFALGDGKMVGAHNHYPTHQEDDISIVPIAGSGQWDGVFRYGGAPPVGDIPIWLLSTAKKRKRRGNIRYDISV